MTIKEVEQILKIPRATVRFYEKQKLYDIPRNLRKFIPVYLGMGCVVLLIFAYFLEV